jgi:cell division protein FtsZ
MALMGIGKAKGEDAALQALHNAAESPLLDKMSLSGAKGILIHFHIHPEISLFAINEVMTKLNSLIDGNAEIIFGTTTDESLSNDEVKITIVATGFEIQTDESLDKKDDLHQKTPRSDDYELPPLMRNYQLKYQLR